MKVLFVLENLADQCGANVNIAIKLSKELKKYGHDISVLTRYDELKPISSVMSTGFSNVYSFYSNQASFLHSFTSGNKWENMNSKERMFSLAKKPSVLVKMLDAKYFNFRFTEKDYIENIEAVCAKKSFSAVIGVVAPYYIANAIHRSKISAKKYLIQLDPYTYNYTLPKQLRKVRKVNEKKVIDGMDTVFAVSFVYDELKNKGITDARNIVRIELPGIDKIDSCFSQASVIPEERRKIHMLFAGQFYQDIRNPKYLLDIIVGLPEQYVFHIVGTGCEGMVLQYKKQYEDKFVLHGRVSKAECDELIKQADVLVNLNNIVDNQLPSKILEYICTGKTILNICKQDNCLSLPIISNYSKSVTIFETKELNIEYLAYIDAEIRKKMHLNIDIENVLKNFDDYTFTSIAKKIEKGINK